MTDLSSALSDLASLNVFPPDVWVKLVITSLLIRGLLRYGTTRTHSVKGKDGRLRERCFNSYRFIQGL